MKWWEGLPRQQRETARLATLLWKERDNDGVGMVHCGQVIQRGPWHGRQCPNPAGQGTEYEYGKCVAHGGAKRAGRMLGAWLMAHKFAEELDCTPWEGLLRAVKIAAGKVSYCQWVVGNALSDLELEGRIVKNDMGVILDPDTLEPLGVGEMRNRSWWVAKEELWVDRLARYSKAAIDAGVAQILLEREIRAGEAMATVLSRTLEALDNADVPAEVLSIVRGIMGQELRALDASANANTQEGGDNDGKMKEMVIDGELGS